MGHSIRLKIWGLRLEPRHFQETFEPGMSNKKSPAFVWLNEEICWGFLKNVVISTLMAPAKFNCICFLESSWCWCFQHEFVGFEPLPCSAAQQFWSLQPICSWWWWWRYQQIVRGLQSYREAHSMDQKSVFSGYKVP